MAFLSCEPTRLRGSCLPCHVCRSLRGSVFRYCCTAVAKPRDNEQHSLSSSPAPGRSLQYTTHQQQPSVKLQKPITFLSEMSVSDSNLKILLLGVYNWALQKLRVSMIRRHNDSSTSSDDPIQTSTSDVLYHLTFFFYATAFRLEADAYMFCSCFFLFFPVHQNYETTVLGNGWTDFHETFTKR